MINALDNEMDNFINSNPPQIQKADPIDSAIDSIQGNNETKFAINQKKVENDNPDEYAKYYEVSKREKLPVDFVKRNWSNFSNKKPNLNFNELAANSPRTTEFLNNPENMGLFQDDVNFFSKIESNLESPKLKDKSFFEKQTIAFNQGLNSFALSSALLGHSYGMFDEDTGANIISKLAKNDQYLRNLTPKSQLDFQETMKKEGGDVNLAYSKLLSSFEDFKNDELLDSILNVAKSGASTAYEALDLGVSAFKSPSELSSMISQNIPNAIPSIGLSVAGIPFGPAGFVAGSFSGGVFSEVGGSIQEELNSQKIDLSDKNKVIETFRKKEFIENVKTRAEKKGVTTAAVDSLFSLFGGSFLKSAATSTIKGKALALGKELAVQSAGETLSEGAGQFAREGGDISKVDVGESLLEGITSLGQSIGDTAVGSVRQNAFSSSNVQNLKNAVTIMKQSVNDKLEILKLRNIKDSVKESKSFNRAPDKVKEFIDSNDQGVVYFQSDDFDKLVKEGESPLEKADELLPNGRKQYLEAKENGGLIEVSKSHFVTEISQKNNEAENVVRVSPTSLNMKEIEQVEMDFESFVQDVTNKAKEEIIGKKNETENFEKVKTDIQEQLVNSGVDKNTAEIYSEAFTPFKTIAERSGQNAYDLYRSFGITVERGDKPFRQVTNEEAIASYQKEINEIPFTPKLNKDGTLAKKQPKINFPSELASLQLSSKEEFNEIVNNKNHPKHSLFLDIVEKKKETILNQEGHKGQIRISTDRKFSIEIFKGADKSTFLHESGHLFLEVLGDIAEKENAPQELKDDFGAVLKYLGVNNRKEIQTKHHELWARSFETYLYEGKAPNKELKSAFRQFRVWLTSIYSKLLKSNVKLTKEVRDVMNRLFASQEEIKELSADNFDSVLDYKKQVEQVVDNKSLSLELSKAHSEAKQEAEEILVSEQMKKLETKQSSQYQAVKTEITKEIEKELSETQFYSAILATRDENIRIDRDNLKLLVGEDIVNNLPNYLLKNNGIDPQMFADTFGYDSIDEFLSDFGTHATYENAVEILTTKRMDELYPELSDTKDLREEALSAIHNESASTLKRKELEYLWDNSPKEIRDIIKKIGSRIEAPEQVKRMAEKEILTQKVKDIRPYKYFQLENKYRKEAISAFTRGDFAKMYSFKRLEFLNHEYFKLAQNTVKDQQNFRDKFRKIFKQKAEKISAKYEMNILNIVKEFLHLQDILPLTDKREKTLEQYFKTLEKVSPEEKTRVDELRSIALDFPVGNYKELTLDQFNELASTLEMLTTLAREEKEIEVDGQKVQVDNVIVSILDNISSIPPHGVTDINTFSGKWKMRYLSAVAAMTQIKHLILKLDNHNPLGPLNSFLLKPLRTAQAKYLLVFEQKKEKLNKVIEEHFQDIFKDKTEHDISEYIKDSKGKYTRHQILMMILHSGNESNLRKLVLGYNWSKLDENSNVDYTEYKNFLNEMHKQNVITDQHLEGVQKIWDLLEELKPQVQRSFKKVYGRFMSEIQSQEITIGGKTLAGGYMPAITDPLQVEGAASRENKLSFEQDQQKFAFSGPAKGFTKDRQENYARQLLLDFRLILGHIEQAVKFGELAVDANNAHKIIKNNRFREAIASINPEMPNTTFDSWLSRYAIQRTEKVYDYSLARTMASWGRILKRNTVQQIMFLNIRNAIENLTDIPSYLAKVDYADLQSSTLSYVKNPKDFVETITQLSPYMERRMSDSMRNVNDQYKSMVMASNDVFKKFEKLQDFFDKHAFFLQKVSANMVEAIGWQSAYNKALNQGLEGKEAVAFADTTVQTISGGNTALDVSTIESGGALSKMLLTFYGYFLNKLNALYYAENKVKQFPYLVSIPAILSSILYRTFTGKFDEDEDDKIVDDLSEVFLLSQFNFVVAGIPAMGTASRFIQGTIDDKAFNDRLSISPIVQQIEASGGIVRLSKTLMNDDELKAKDIKDSLTFIGLLTSTPLGSPMIKHPIGFMMEVNSGKQNPEKPIDYIRGFTTGKSE